MEDTPLSQPSLDVSSTDQEIEVESASESKSSSANSDKSVVPTEAKLYKYVAEGRIDDITAYGRSLDVLKSKKDGNSVLHIAASTGQSLLIKTVLPTSKNVVKWKNNKSESPFHCAAKASDYKSLQALMNWNEYDQTHEIGRELLGEENCDGDTPLHIAVENDEQQMAELLVDQYYQACYMVNNKDESPLYLAINKSGFSELVKKMINYSTKDKEGAQNELRRGKSVVHAAIDSNNSEILKDVIEKLEGLVNILIDEGQSPLCYAAFKGDLGAVKYLIEKFPECAYQRDKEGSFPIHKAASGGNIKVILKLLMTKKLLNGEGQNILHVAAKSGQSKVVSFILKMPELEGLINHKDVEGNTPLHLASKGCHPRVVYILTRERRCSLGLLNKDGSTALDVVVTTAKPIPTFEARLTWLALRYVNAPQSSVSASKGIKTAKQENDTKELERFTKRIDTHMLMATLVATVTFAAGFAPPGGYNQSDQDPNAGMAVLPHKWPFQVFVICNTAALYSSILSVVTLIWAFVEDVKLTTVSLRVSLPLLGFALAMMSLAFMMGVSVALRTQPWLSYVVLGMGSLLLLGLLLIFIPLFSPAYIRNPVMRFFFYGSFLLLLFVCEKSSIAHQS